MHVGAKRISFLGLLLAFNVILVVLSGIFEFNTLFLLAAAAFCVGIAIKECGLKLGTGFLVGAVILSLILAPNKMYCFTYGVMGLYILIEEIIWYILKSEKWDKSRKKIWWISKYIVFNIIYIPAIIFFPKIIYQGKISPIIIIGLILVGQIAIFIYDKAYNYFLMKIWDKFKLRLTNLHS